MSCCSKSLRELGFGVFNGFDDFCTFCIYAFLIVIFIFYKILRARVEVRKQAFEVEDLKEVKFVLKTEENQRKF